MKEIIFNECGMENYGPYIDPMVLKFNNNTITMITGPNGIGKTTALDCIPYTLFGITSKGMKGDELVNNTVNKNCHTWVKFQVNEIPYQVDRFQKSSKNGNTVLLKVNSVTTHKGSKEVVPIMENLLCSSKAFMNTLMFGQKIKDFFTDLIDSEKKAIFREILDLDIYTKYYAKSDEIIKGIKPLLEEIKGKIALNNGLISDANLNIYRLNEEKKIFEQEKLKLIAKEKENLEISVRLKELHEKKLVELGNDDCSIDHLIKEISQYQAELNSIDQTRRSSYDVLQAKKNEKNQELSIQAVNEKTKILNEAIKNIEELRDNITNNISLLKVDFDKETKELITIEANINSKKARISTIQADIKELVDSISIDVCPTCNQRIGDECKILVNQKISEKDIVIDRLNMEISSLVSTLSHIKIDLKKLKSEIDFLSQSFDKQATEVEQDKNIRVNEIDNKLKILTEQVSQIFYTGVLKLDFDTKARKEVLLKLIDRINVEIGLKKDLKEKRDYEVTCIKDIERTIESYNREITRLDTTVYDEKQIKLYVEKRFSLTKDNEKLTTLFENKNREISITEFWKTGYSPSGMPSMLIDEAIPFMNKTISEYLEKFGGRYIVSFDTLAANKAGEFRDKISVNVLDTYTKANSRVQLSGGQIRLLDIATILTLGELQAKNKDFKTNLLIFDEIFDALDDSNIEFVAKVLTQIKKDKSIYVISHRHVDQVEADEVLALK
jgi:DNA repair exonuclease SbcCD ATPase subunit